MAVSSKKSNEQKKKKVKQLLEEKEQQINDLGYVNTKKAPVKSSYFKDAPVKTTTDEIAPVKNTTEEKKKWYQGWLQKGALENGITVKSVNDAILGTSDDMLADAGTGFFGSGEKALDALAIIAPYFAQAQFNQGGGVYNIQASQAFNSAFDTMKAGSEELVKKDLYDEAEIAKQIVMGLNGNVDYEANSVLGDKTDSLVQSAGQMAGTAALNAVGVPWWLTTGLTAMGGQSENALNQGASYDEAAFSGLVSAGAEILTEKLSGAIKFGGKTLDDKAVDFLARNISDSFWRNAAKFGLDFAGEGLEEVGSDYLTKFGEWLSFRSDEELGQILFSRESLLETLESFIGGSLMGGSSNVVSNVTSKITGVDPVTGLTKNEQAVVDRAYKDAVADVEKNGKITEKEKAKIYDRTLEDLDKGYISIDLIEELLGGEAYEKYRSTVAHEENLQKEFDELGKKQYPTLSETTRYNELDKQLKDIKEKDLRSQLKSQLSDSVQKQIQTENGKGNRLIESYNERARRSQAFEADLSKYSPEQQKTVKSAIDSGLLNNTNRSHEMVDLVAKLAEDKGMPFDFTNNEKIKGTMFEVKDRTVNAYKADGKITLNVDSPKYLQTTVGHEITHVLEVSDLYNTLKDAVVEFAKNKGEYDTRLAETTELYKNVKDADVEAELVADLVGEYLFQDADFVYSLSTKDRDLFDKAFDEIKYFCKIATTGSKELRQLEKLKKTFEEVYRSDSNKSSTSGDTSQFSLYYRPDFNNAEWAIVNRRKHSEFDNPKYDLDIDKKWMYANEKGYSVFAIYSKNDIDDPTVLYGSSGKNAIRDHEKLSLFLSGGRNAKRGRGALDRLLASIERNEANRSNGITYFEGTISPIEDVSISIEEPTSNRQRDFGNGTENLQSALTEYNDEASEISDASVTFSNDYAFYRNFMKEDVVDAEQLVSDTSDSTQFSLTDSDGKQLSNDQSEFFKLSKARDENGNLYVVYNGSNTRWTVPNKNGGLQWWSVSKDYSDNYRQKNNAFNLKNQTTKAYLDIKNPIDIGNTDWYFEPSKWNAGNEQYSAEFLSLSEKLGIDVETLAEIANQSGNRLWHFVQSPEFVQMAKDAGFDGIKANEFGNTVFATFNPEQAKLTKNLKPSNNPDVRYSVSDDSANGRRQGAFATPANELAYEGVAPVRTDLQAGDALATNVTEQNVATNMPKFERGQLVKASDRGNYGFVYDYDDAYDLYTVRFTNKDGFTKDVEFEAKDLSPVLSARDMFPNTPDIDQMDYENAHAVMEATQNRLAELAEMDLNDPELAAEYDYVLNSWIEAQTKLLELNTKFNEQVDSLTDADAPPVKHFDAPVKPIEHSGSNSSKKSKGNDIGHIAATAWVDKGAAVETLSLETGNMELQAKWNSALPTNTDAMAQYFMEHANGEIPALKSIMDEINKSGNAELFDSYLKHLRNIDSMSLQDRMNLPNIPVFGDDVTQYVSRSKVNDLDVMYPDFKRWAEQIYDISNYLLDELVKENLITQESADYLRSKYPHYIPLKRTGKETSYSDSTADNKKASVGNTIKTATGGNGELDSSFNALAERIQQHYRAIARNRFGIELKNTLNSASTSQQNLLKADDMLDMFDGYENGLLNAGRVNGKPTFTVFEDGKRIEFEITDELYDALKPTSKGLAYRNPFLTSLNEGRRKLLTVWNPVFSLYRNPVKDFQDVAINSQHTLKTYANVPNAIFQLATGGEFANEYHKNGGLSNTFYDSKKNQFKAEDNLFKKIFGMPFRAIEKAGEFIEQVPRLAEYIASRKEGRTIERSMLDAARVTTNFAAGGDYTKLLNAHGATFLNASVQGAAQHVRNFREAAKLEGVKGVTKTLAKYVIAGVPAMIFNGLIWDDDEDYEELNDYIKDNYYIIAKMKNGQFVRIPKGRTAAVMSELMEQMGNLVTGNDEVDFDTFFDLFWDNIAPNNPLTDNMIAPLVQTLTNNAWYSADIVPKRLQGLPAEEQYDESTDIVSKWLGEKLSVSPMKINYLLDQYLGGIGDVVLPMLTPEVESGDDSFMGNMLAPWKKELVVDKVLDNKNPGELFELSDKLESIANSKNATDADKLKAKYVDAIGWQMSDLYAEKREIQSSNLPADVKYDQIRQLQEEINELARTTLADFEDVVLEGNYAEVGSMRFNKNPETGTWYQIKPKNADGSDNSYYVNEQLTTQNQGLSYSDYWNGKYSEPESLYGEFNGKRYHYDTVNRRWSEIKSNNADGSLNSTFAKEQFVTNALGISYDEYWNNKQEYDFQYEYPEKYEFLKEVGVSVKQYQNFDEKTRSAYTWASNNRDAYTVSKAVASDVVKYRKYTSDLYAIKADKDKYGNSISGSRKKKVIEYINNLNADYGEKIILYKTEYPSDDSYNRDILDYINKRKDLTYEEKITILKQLHFSVDSKGNVSW